MNIRILTQCTRYTSIFVPPPYFFHFLAWPKKWQKTQGASIVRPLLPFCRKTLKHRDGFLVFLAKSQFTLDCPVMRQGHRASKRRELVQQIGFVIGVSLMNSLFKREDILSLR